MAGNTVNEAYAFTATIGGSQHTQAEPNGLEYLMVEDHVDMIGMARFSLNLDHGNWSSFEFGADVEVKVGKGQRKMFVGVITGMRHARKNGREMLTVIAMDPLAKAGASRRTEIYEDLTDSDIVNQVIGRAGLEAGQIDSTSTTHPYVLQRNESDLEFMKRLAARNNYLLRTNEGKVDFVKPQFGGGAVEISESMLEDLDYTMNAAQVPPGITTQGWDYVATDKVEGTAGAGDIETIGSGQNAVEAASRIWTGGNSFLADVDVDAQGNAKDIAVSELNRIARNFLRGSARIDGNSEVFAGAKVRFTGHPTGYNAEVYVISSRHLFEFKRGYTTEFKFCSNTLPT